MGIQGRGWEEGRKLIKCNEDLGKGQARHIYFLRKRHFLFSVKAAARRRREKKILDCGRHLFGQNGGVLRGKKRKKKGKN